MNLFFIFNRIIKRKVEFVREGMNLMKRTYNYHETKKQLEEKKQQLCKKLKNTNLTDKERDQIKMEIDNYEYILTLVEMNHFERGISH